MKFFKRTDILVIIGILVVSAASWGVYSHVADDRGVKAEIYYYNDLVETVDLNGEERSFSIPQDENVILHLYQDGSIAFVESDCPDKVCIHAGKQRMAGQFAACLPNGIVVKIVSDKERGEDDTDLVI
ncbi:MAG TPA: NusG domain II-containing protein [Anaerovoracaceae bacterium]|nr:NusG domain II-containing protein [Anaerovoracaceae bacterium]